MTLDDIKVLDTDFNFSNSKNAEIFSAWAKVAISKQHHDINQPLEEFLVKTGRRKFLRPLYKELIKTEDGKKMALDIY